jgi:hypothetical protein
MKLNLSLLTVVAGALLLASCSKSTNSDEYASNWKPYSGTTWKKPATALNFSAINGGFQFDANISTANTVDTLGVNLAGFIPTMYQISNFETASDAQLAVSVSVTSPLDSMKLKTMIIDPTTHDTTLYEHFQFGRVRGSIQTFGKDSVLTQPRVFGQDALFTYAPSVHPDSCSRQIALKLILNWNSYTGRAVLDTLKTTKVTVTVRNMAFTVNGVDILK